MTLHHFQPDHYHQTLGCHAPVLHIWPGDTVVTTTIDAGGSDMHGVQVAERPNPCLLYTSPSTRDRTRHRMPSSG